MNLLSRLRNVPFVLETAYKFTKNMFHRLNPLFQRIGYERADRFVRVPEKLAKGAVFNCQMCGQCVLHFTGMTCPMGCPKNLRNGPCGGVRVDKTCEVDPTMKCVWVEAFERSQKMKIYGDGIFEIRPPLNYRLAGRSAFINILASQSDGMPAVWQTQTGIAHDRK